MEPPSMDRRGRRSACSSTPTRGLRIPYRGISETMSNENARGNQNYPTDDPDASSRDDSRANQPSPSPDRNEKVRTGHRGTARSSEPSDDTTPKSPGITDDGSRSTRTDEREGGPQYRLRFHFGEITLVSTWQPDLAPVESLGVQLIQGSEFHDISIERCTEVTRR